MKIPEHIVQELEQQLHCYDNRKNSVFLKQILHKEFKEIGYSGRVFDYQSIMDDIALEQPPDFKVHAQQFELVTLTNELIQLSYQEARMDSAGLTSRHALRTSLWQLTKNGWQIRFHQATPTNSFEIKDC